PPTHQTPTPPPNITSATPHTHTHTLFSLHAVNLPLLRQQHTHHLPLLILPPQLTSSKMARSGMLVVMALVVLVAALTNARYLPTRADDSRLEEIRELLREVLERTADGGSSISSSSSRVSGSGYDKRFLFKRAAAAEGGVAGEVVEPLLNLPQ
ncbi:hypothetical protein OTU49_016849, partial [Cherax quadricarinatus]